MSSQNLTLTEAQRRLDVLVRQSRQTGRSILITTDDGQALAWLAPAPDPAVLRRDQQAALLNAHLSLLEELLRAFASGEATSDTVALFHDQLHALYQSAIEAPPLFRQVVLLSRLALESLGEARLQPDQALALRYGLELMRRPTITEDDLRQFNHRLMDSHLYPGVPFDEALLSQYLNES
jgi:hypothetical protein